MKNALVYIIERCVDGYWIARQAYLDEDAAVAAFEAMVKDHQDWSVRLVHVLRDYFQGR